jgi:hypothetical protein
VDDPRTSSFAAHVHEVVDLDKHGASLEAVEASIDSMPIDVEESSALWLLAWSLRNGVTLPQAVESPGRVFARG